MHSSFFHLKVIVFIHVWFAECWNSSQATLISPSLILFPFVRLETGNMVAVSGQIQSITLSDSLHLITCTPGPVEPVQPSAVPDVELELLFAWSGVALGTRAQGWSLKSRLSEEGEDFLGLTVWIAAIGLRLCWSVLRTSSPILVFLIAWMRGLHWPLLAGPQPPEPRPHPALCFALGGTGLLCKKGTQTPWEII